jgi:hypothetical protein
VRRLALALLVLLALPAPALAGVELTEFAVEPSSLQAGGHPSVKITQAFSYTNTSDDVQDTFVRLAPGLLGNPQNAAFCTGEQMRSSGGCPASAKVGSVVVTAGVIDPILHLRLTGLTVPGTVYNLKPTGSEPARIGLALDALGGLQKSYLDAPVRLRPGPDGVRLEPLFEKQPRDACLDVQIERVELTFDAQASKGSFMRMPTSCATGSSLARVNSYEAPAAFSEKTVPLTPTGCDRLAFAPTAAGSLGAPDQLLEGDVPPLSTTLRFDPEHVALNRAEVTLPTSLAPNEGVLILACLRAQADVTACPEGSRLGTASIDSPLQAEPVRGPVYLAYNTPSPLPGLMVVLPPPVDLRIDGVVDPGTFGGRNIFPAQSRSAAAQLHARFPRRPERDRETEGGPVRAEDADHDRRQADVALGPGARVRAGAGHARLRPARPGHADEAPPRLHAGGGAGGGPARPGHQVGPGGAAKAPAARAPSTARARGRPQAEGRPSTPRGEAEARRRSAPGEGRLEAAAREAQAEAHGGGAGDDGGRAREAARAEGEGAAPLSAGGTKAILAVPFRPPDGDRFGPRSYRSGCDSLGTAA